MEQGPPLLLLQLLLPLLRLLPRPLEGAPLLLLLLQVRHLTTLTARNSRHQQERSLTSFACVRVRIRACMRAGVCVLTPD
jgi:hypothetical protein